ncbi:RNA polymerase subunit sigma-24 [Clostridium saccharoperbutylacetonicum]|uniref:RNA polymerase subunit sigma-24 n=1 Tax=Clostridium saccharoperbutylacetonicum TaxID=36745 RepID=UPI001570894C|nr:RNA polymerase subunit sigma-24 [Clostridium saccharoperbutylacetonicum]NSB31402.1 DNA-directed RNA polymerase specialized sigma24 family protein [Clostridium saccharoperbutylacetonicum]
MYDDIKQRLRNYKKILAKKNEYELQINELEEEIGIPEQPQGEVTGKTYKITSIAENQALYLAEKKFKLEQLVKINKRECEHIENALRALKEWQRQAITLKFIDGRREDNICYIMDKVPKTIRKYIRESLKELEEILDNKIEE